MFNVEALIAASDIPAILTSFGIDWERRKNSRGTELYHNCTNPEHDDGKKKSSIAEQGQYKGVFYCWSCHDKGNLITIIRRMLNLDFKAACEWLDSIYHVGVIEGVNSARYTLRNHKRIEILSEVELSEIQLPDDYVPCGYGYSETEAVEEFLNSRNINIESMIKFEIGSCYHQHIGYSLVIPLKFKGKTVSLFWAQPWSGGLKRYPTGAPTGRILFNYDSITDSYIMVESILDVIKLDSLGIPNAVACFSNMISETQLNLISKMNRHAVFPDNDSPRGWDLVGRMVAMIGKSINIVMPPLGKDPGACSVDEIKQAFENQKLYCDWEVDQLMLRVRPKLRATTVAKK